MLKKYVYISCVKEKKSGDIREYQCFESTKYWYSIAISQALLFSRYCNCMIMDNAPGTTLINHYICFDNKLRLVFCLCVYIMFILCCLKYQFHLIISPSKEVYMFMVM